MKRKNVITLIAIALAIIVYWVINYIPAPYVKVAPGERAVKLK